MSLRVAFDPKLLARDPGGYLVNGVMQPSPERPERADALLETLVKMHLECRNNDKSLRPDYRCFDKCLQARANCGDLSGAVQTLKRFVEEYRDARALDVPSEIGIDIVHRCCMQNDSEEATHLASEVLAIKEQLRKEGNLREHQAMRYQR